ncbi:[citrate (pro-3S)-lyase] ligase [Streptococcus halichoeri]|uniref:[citrate (pro-3S)-lyase] ligase n=1 Tax=Streptococcus halichoeri TaxID=254785 RepID=UPI001C8E36AD|nr:[citrate (pro-3S)-lyase] ligase [Streptococcus halichoeri]
MAKIQDIFLKNPKTKQEWQSFLRERGIENFAKGELAGLTQTIGIYEADELVATGSLASNVIKYVASSQKDGRGASYFNSIISRLEQDLIKAGHTHYFVFTKEAYRQSFQHVGFKELAHSDFGAILEKGHPDINDYLHDFPVGDPQLSNAAIVMNANPFTLGHRYLVEKAAQENDWVYVFVLSEDKSLFTTSERMHLVKAGLSHLKNVIILPTSDYLVSYTTFPAYFIQDDSLITSYQTQLDARLFKRWLVPYFAITRRYLGQEPFSQTTALYNQMLQKELAPEVEVVILERKKTKHDVISATEVRKKIAAQDLTHLDQLVPPTSYAFIEEHLLELHHKMKEGKK